MTRQDAIATIAALTPMTPADVEGFLACTDEEREWLIRTYRDAGIMPSASAWAIVIEVLRGCAEFASLVNPITATIMGVFGVVSVLKK